MEKTIIVESPKHLHTNVPNFLSVLSQVKQINKLLNSSKKEDLKLAEKV
jgi:hypothetical protein